MLLQYGLFVLLTLAAWNVAQAGRGRPRHSRCPGRMGGPIGDGGCTSHADCTPPQDFCVIHRKDEGNGVCCNPVPELDDVCYFGDADLTLDYCTTDGECTAAGATGHYCNIHPLGRWAICCPICLAGHSASGPLCNLDSDCGTDYCGARGLCCIST